MRCGHWPKPSRIRFGAADVSTEQRLVELESTLAQIKLDPAENVPLLASQRLRAASFGLLAVVSGSGRGFGCAWRLQTFLRGSGLLGGGVARGFERLRMRGKAFRERGVDGVGPAVLVGPPCK